MFIFIPPLNKKSKPKLAYVYILLICALNSNLTYNEWQSLAAKNGITLWYRKNAIDCEIRVLGICTVSVDTTGFVLGTLPTNYRPEDYICFSYVSGFYVRVRETGSVELVNTGTSVVNQSIRFSAIYGL